ncbi:MAG TPA: hypothetical protein VFV93_16390 [Thermomicrobiales bacterium]|nr:hypothetical protein [Thermomicrobiales bacterium]
MRYRLVARPPSWMDVTLVLVEDAVGDLYLFNQLDRSLVQTFTDEMQSLIHWFEFSQAVTWYTRSELIQKLSAVSIRIRLTRRRDSTGLQHALLAVACLRLLP